MKRGEWKSKIRDEYGITLVSEIDVLDMIENEDTLWTTRCCKTKLCMQGYPIDMYDSYVTRHFYKFVLEHELPFAIVSDKYGLHFFDETLAYYDTHPQSLSQELKKYLGEEMRRKAWVRNFDTIIFYNNSPLMSKPYFEMLSYSGIKTYYTTKLPQALKNVYSDPSRGLGRKRIAVSENG